MKPKKLKQEQFEVIKRSNEKHCLFTFDMTHPFYYVIDHVFSDPRKRMLVYFDEEESKLVWIEELREGTGLNTPIVQEWIKEYHKKKKREEKEKLKAKEEKRIERAKQKEAAAKENSNKKSEIKSKAEVKKPSPKTKTEKKNPSPKPNIEKKKPGPKPKNTTKKDGTPRKKPGPKPKKPEDVEGEK